MGFSMKAISFGLIILTSITVHDAFAYIDPGTGSAVLQALIGVIVAAAIGLSVYWQKLKMKIAMFRK
jgi:hypothetical protein